MKLYLKPLSRQWIVSRMLVFILVTILVLSGCGGGNSNTSPTSNPTTTNPPTSSIMEFPPGKYNNTLLVTGGLLRISWSTTEDTIFIGIKAKTTGWVAIALAPNLQKGRSDLIIGYVSGSDVSLVDSYDPGYSGNHPRDAALGGTDDLQGITGSEANGVTTIEFKRLLNTHDSLDVQFVNGTNSFLYALGANDNTSAEHSLVGFGEITLTLVQTHP